MHSALTVEEFIDVVHRSQLVSQDLLIDALSDCKHNGGLPQQAIEVADYLQGRGLITDWQQKKLLAGRTKGFLLGDYCLLDHLGSGGMSSVFLARHRLIDRRVAIKVLPSAKLDEGSYLDRFEQEARLTSRLSHPNVVRVFDIDQQGSTHFMVMEYVPGQDLKAMVRQAGPLPLDQAAHYIAQAGFGLEHAHQRGLIHRDIKPANLVVNHEDVLKILDLGLALPIENRDLGSLTVQNEENLMGTADFLSPEQARNAHAVDHRADIYSLGCTLYYLLTGHAPFTEGTIAQRILLHQTQMPLDVRAIREDCPHAIADVCMTMLAKDPDDRVPTAGIVAQRLHHWLQANGKARPGATYHALRDTSMVPSLPHRSPRKVTGLPVEPTESVVQTRKARAARKHRVPVALWAVLGVLVVVCVILAVVIAWR